MKAKLNRRKFVKDAMTLTAIAIAPSSIFSMPRGSFSASDSLRRRVRPGDKEWPSPEMWDELKASLNGTLLKIDSPLDGCKLSTQLSSCADVFKELKNPYYISDTPAFTQTSGWYKAWQSAPSVYAIEASSTADIVAGVNFARTHNIRLVIKGGGHSYQGNSNCADSLLIWTRHMKNIHIDQEFHEAGAGSHAEPFHAVTIEAGALWLEAYNEVTTKNGRYVQGGGCTTVGVAGFIQGGGFGSFSKYYGIGAAGLLEAEIITADGEIKTVNRYQSPDEFWALKGGGGGSFGVVSKVTLRTRELPETFGAVFGSIKAKTDEAFKELIKAFINHYQKKLFNPRWGEQVEFHSNNVMNISMLFHGLSKEEAQSDFKEFEDWVSNFKDCTIQTPLSYVVLPARKLWDPEFLKKYASKLIDVDDRPEASPSNIFWLSNKQEAGQYLYGYKSCWLAQELLHDEKQSVLADAVFNASRFWTISLHFNKGLAGAMPEVIEDARNSAMNPAVLTSFALAIIAGQGEPAFEGIKGHEPDFGEAKAGAKNISMAMDALKKASGDLNTYLAESDYFDKNWKKSFWGSNYNRLLSIKEKVDPKGLFFVHHGVGSEYWNEDGFVPKQ
jgi:FAD binding domain/Berberine and berberine like